MRIRRIHIISAICALILLAGCDPTKRLAEGQYLLDQNKVVVKQTSVPKSELEPIIKQRPNKRVLLMRFYLWLYNIPDPAKLEERRVREEQQLAQRNEERVARGKQPKGYKRSVGEWLRETVGEPPVIFDTLQMYRSTEQIRLYMQKEGWFHAQVEDSIHVRHRNFRDHPSVTVEYTVRPGPEYRYRNITYTVDDPTIHHHVQQDWKNSHLRPGQRFDADELDKERSRITDRLREMGYLFFTRDLVAYTADTTVGDHQVDIVMQLERPFGKDKHLQGTPEGTIYTINDVTINTARLFAGGRRIVPDTVKHKGYELLHEGRPRFRPNALLSAVFFRPDDRYQQSNSDLTYRRLTALRVFDRVDITYDTTGTGRPGLANARIDLLPAKTQGVSTEGFGTNRGGFLGTSINVGYRHRNMFRSMGLLQATLTLGLEAQQSLTGSGSGTEEQTTGALGNNTLFNTINIGPEISLQFPHFIFPGAKREWFGRSAAPRTSVTALYNFQQRPDFTRTLAKLSFGYEWNESAGRIIGLYPIEVNVINIPQRSDDFIRYLQEANDPVLTNSYTDHLIVATRAMLTMTTPENVRRRNIYFFRPTIELAYGVPHFLGTEQAVDTAGNRFYTYDRIRYAQYAKLDVESRLRHIIHDKSSLAFRLGGGIGVPYGNLDVLPFESSFFVGGANGLRAWRARSVGPGSYSAPLLAFDRIGEIRIEANAEYRFDLIGFLEGALFVDAGNIWNIDEDPRKPGSEFRLDRFASELAIGTGFGARLNFDFFLIRFDLGLQTKDPSLPIGERWLFQPKTKYLEQLETEGVTVLEYKPQLNFNLGIGYPF